MPNIQYLDNKSSKRTKLQSDRNFMTSHFCDQRCPPWNGTGRPLTRQPARLSSARHTQLCILDAAILGLLFDIYDNSATFFVPSWNLLRHTQVGPGIIKSRLHYRNWDEYTLQKYIFSVIAVKWIKLRIFSDNIPREASAPPHPTVSRSAAYVLYSPEALSAWKAEFMWRRQLGNSVIRNQVWKWHLKALTQTKHFILSQQT
jgi:hypothetical protein